MNHPCLCDICLDARNDELLRHDAALRREIGKMIEEMRPHHEFCDAYKNHQEGNRYCLDEEVQDSFAQKIIAALTLVVSFKEINYILQSKKQP